MANYHIPTPSFKDRGRLPESVAINPSQADDEALPYLISYEMYNDSECEIKDLLKNIARTALLDLRKIGNSTKKKLGENGIDYLPVSNSGAYTSLYNKLPPDVEIKEHKISGDSRLFYTTSGRRFYIICIKNSHIETKKHRK